MVIPELSFDLGEQETVTRTQIREIKGSFHRKTSCNDQCLKEMIGKKVRWEVHKDATCCLEQILKVSPIKTAAVRSFILQTSQLGL